MKTKSTAHMLTVYAISAGMLALFSGCSEEIAFTSNVSRVEIPPVENPGPRIAEVPDEPEGPSICDPNQVVPASSEHGIRGKMSLLPESTNLSSPINLSYFWSPDLLNPLNLTPSIDVPAVFYFSEVNVPERAFSEGFSYNDGGALRDPRDVSGDTLLIEWFSLKLEGHLKLGSATAGNYYLSLIADDGAKLEILSDGTWTELINNDGTHPEKMGCSLPGSYLSLNSKSDIRYRITYFQGPRYHISLTLLWKRLDSGEENISADPLCGRGGNDFFHDSRVTPSVPTSNWAALVSRGWSPVPAANFYLPSGSVNPCVETE